MADDQKIYNHLIGDYVVETEQQPDNAHRQVVKVGNEVTVTGTVTSIPSGTQDVNIVSDAAGLATSANQTTANTSLSTIAGDTTSLDTKVTACDTGNVTVSSSALPTGAATAANQSTIIGHVDGIESQLTTIASNQLADGHNVTIDNGSGLSAVNIQDGGNSITVDGSVTAIPSGTQDVNIASDAAGLATAANQLPDGHNVTVDNGAGASAVNIQDGGNSITVDDGGGSITVDGTVTANQGGSPWQVEDEVLSNNTTLTAINTTYNNTTTTAVSANISCAAYREAAISFEITKANTPTDILFEIEGSLDGTNYARHVNGPLGSILYDDTAVGASGIKRCLVFPIAYNNIRVRVTCTGTSASNTFTVANANLFLRN